MLIAVYLIVCRWFGTSEAAWALLRGEDVVVIPSTVHLGDCLPGDVKEIKFRVVNMSSAPVTLTGLYTSCSCILASSLPVTLEANGACKLRITVHSSGDRGNFTRRAVLYTDSPRSRHLPMVVTGTMLEHDEDVDLEPIPIEASAYRSSSAAIQ
ncbi:MAG: DUF1573 domain-containing protein [Pirellulales bacterium]